MSKFNLDERIEQMIMAGMVGQPSPHALKDPIKQLLRDVLEEVIGPYESPETLGVRLIGVPSGQRDALREELRAKVKGLGL